MNYLSHFYIHQQGQNPLYSVGLIFPDLSRGFVKLPGKLSATDYAYLLPIAEGCLQHYRADKQFHGSKFFEWGSHECSQVLKSAAFEGSVERRWFISHILFELLLDRLLVNHQPQVGIDFYADIRAVSLQELKDFIVLHPHQDYDKFLHFFEHFRRAAYIQNYPDNNLFAFSLSRIMKKAGLPELSHTNKIVLQECVWNLEDNAFKNVQGILQELKEVFKI
ncbi:MAG: hypothetical protein ACOVK9_02345 [Bacteroidia bacterium]|jgi:hypothetical protein